MTADRIIPKIAAAGKAAAHAAESPDPVGAALAALAELNATDGRPEAYGLDLLPADVRRSLTYRRQVSALRRQLDAFRVRMIPRI